MDPVLRLGHVDLSIVLLSSETFLDTEVDGVQMVDCLGGR